MGDESTVEYGTEDTNWFQREGNAIKSACCGFVLVILLSVVIFWNESNYVKEVATADEVRSHGVAISSCQYNSANDGKLVVVPCAVTAPDLMHKHGTIPSAVSSMLDEFKGSKLSWTVQIKQYKKVCTDKTERYNCQKTNTGGEHCDTKTTHECHDEEQWMSQPNTETLYSSDHHNTGAIPAGLSDGHVSASDSEIYLSQKEGQKELGFALSSDLINLFPSQTPSGLKQSANGYTLNGNDYTSNGEEIGSIKITLSGNFANQATVAAKQSGQNMALGTFSAWPEQAYNIFGQTTREIKDIHFSKETPDQFATDIENAASAVVWCVRIACLILMFLAFNCIFKPLSVATDLLMFLNYCTCCLGSILDQASQWVISAVSCSCACSCFMILFTVAWMFAHPWYIMLLLFVVIVCCGGLAVAHFYGLFGKEGKVEAREAPLRLSLVADSSQAHFIRCV